ncbi:MAG TPA: polyhydroxybutyrate depolymerase, partial [Sulfitobacter sp.]|nr:polyhydroxybutyrate depolymerase [Sulfitobacter sp.]
CAGDRSVTLDIHTGGHFIPTGWLGYQLDGLMPKTPG